MTPVKKPRRLTQSLCLLALAGMLSTPASTAQSLQVCTTRANLTKLLKTSFAEVAQEHILYTADRKAEVFASPHGSWTAIKTNASGLTCTIDAGKNAKSSGKLKIEITM